MIALGLTVLMVVTLTVFATQTKWDFTVLGGFLFVVLVVFTIAIIIGAFIQNFIMELVLSSIGVALFSIYLICKYFFFEVITCNTHNKKLYKF